jgi:GDPmannose 4,6-dehydratase
MKRALITGVSGQTGSYLAELLLDKGYEVHGLVRRTSAGTYPRIEHLVRGAEPRVELHAGDLADAASLRRVLDRVCPDELYNLGAMSHVAVSYDVPEQTGDVTGLGAVRLLEALRARGGGCRFYQASSSEMFGSSPPPQSEATPFRPRSPYAVAKVYAYHATVNYREAFGLHASNGILFNHEGLRRGEAFVTRKITRAVGRIAHGLQHVLRLGNLDARRDWGHARDYADAVWRIVQADAPDDYVVGTGETRSVREFCAAAFGRVGLDWREFVRQDPRLLRPAEVDALCADASKARARLGWRPATTFGELVAEMVDADLALAERERLGRR